MCIRDRVRTFGEPGKFYRATNLYLFTPDRQRKVWCMFGDPMREDKVRIVNLAFADKTYGPQTNFDQARLDVLALPPGRLSNERLVQERQLQLEPEGR